MALQEDLTAWITRSADQIDLQLVELTWINEWLPGYTDVIETLSVTIFRVSKRSAHIPTDLVLESIVKAPVAGASLTINNICDKCAARLLIHR
jgi:hypothetical protein